MRRTSLREQKRQEDEGSLLRRGVQRPQGGVFPIKYHFLKEEQTPMEWIVLHFRRAKVRRMSKCRAYETSLGFFEKGRARTGRERPSQGERYREVRGGSPEGRSLSSP